MDSAPWKHKRHVEELMSLTGDAKILKENSDNLNVSPQNVAKLVEDAAIDSLKTCVPGYGPPFSSDYPNLDKIPTEADDRINFSREELSNCETVNAGYMFYVINNTVFAKDISGYFYKLNNKTRKFEWFADGWCEDNENTIGITPPSAPTYVSFNKNGGAVFPMNDDKPSKPVLPRNEVGEPVFPLDTATNLPLFPVDFYGEPCLPVGDDGKPFFPLGMDGKPIVPINSEGIAVFPRDEDGKVIFPERDGRIIPPVTIYGNAVVPIKDNGEPEIPCDANGHPLIYLGGHDGMTPMTEDEFKHWQYSVAMGFTEEYQYTEEQYAYDLNAYEMSQNQHMLEAYKHNYYEQSSHYQNGHEEADPQNAAKATGSSALKALETQKEIDDKRLKARLAMQMRSMKMTSKSDKKAPQDEKESPAAVPVDRPPLPNKENKKKERYIPESIRKKPESRFSDNRSDRNGGGGGNSSRFERGRGSRQGYEHRRRSRSKSYSRSRSKSRSRSRSARRRQRSRSTSRDRSITPVNCDFSKRNSRSRSKTWSPEKRRKKDRKSRHRRERSRSSDGSSESRSRNRNHSRRKRRTSSSDSDSDHSSDK